MTTADFRSAEQRASDKDLRGTWFRCPDHGLTDDPIYLAFDAGSGGAWYCPDDYCSAEVLVVHTTAADPKTAPSVWDKSTKKNRTPPVKETPVTDDARPMREIIMELLENQITVSQDDIVRACQAERPAVRAGPVVCVLRRMRDAGTLVQDDRDWTLADDVEEAAEEEGAGAPVQAAGDAEGVLPDPASSPEDASVSSDDDETAGDGMVSGEIPGHGLGSPHETPAPATAENPPIDADYDVVEGPGDDLRDFDPVGDVEATSTIEAIDGGVNLESVLALDHVSIEASRTMLGSVSFSVSGCPEHVEGPLRELMEMVIERPPPRPPPEVNAADLAAHHRRINVALAVALLGLLVAVFMPIARLLLR